jgi:hypothetical protein
MRPACLIKQTTVLSDPPNVEAVLPPLSTLASCEEKSGNDANLRNRNGKSNYILGKNVFVHLHSPVREFPPLPSAGVGGGQGASFIPQELMTNAARCTFILPKLVPPNMYKHIRRCHILNSE